MPAGSRGRSRSIANPAHLIVAVRAAKAQDQAHDFTIRSFSEWVAQLMHGIVVPHDLLAAPGGLVFGQVEHRRGEADQVFLDLTLILAGGGNDRCDRDVPGRVGLVAVVKNAARGFGDPCARARAGLVRDGGCVGRLIRRDQAERFANRVGGFEGAGDDADVRVAAGPRDAGLAGELPDFRSRLFRTKVPPRQRADEVGAPPLRRH